DTAPSAVPAPSDGSRSASQRRSPVCESSAHGLPRPAKPLAESPRRLRRELEPATVIELLSCPHQSNRSLLNQIQKRQTLVAVFLRNRHDKTQVPFDHLLLRAMIAALDPLCQL